MSTGHNELKGPIWLDYIKGTDMVWLVTFFMNQTSKAASYSWNSTRWRKLPLKQPEKTTRR